MDHETPQHPASSAPAPPLWQLAVAFAVALGVGVAGLLADTWLLRTVGLGAGGLALYTLALIYRAARPGLLDGEGARSRWLQRLERSAPLLLVFGLVAGLLWPLVTGHHITSADHPVHMTRAWHFVDHNLSRGQLSGWSDLWFAGWPSGEDYPPGADWWISAVYLGTFGLLGWEGAYAVAFLAAMGFIAWCAYHFGRVYFGRAAGVIAAVLLLLDPGAFREGGWSFTVYWGVWPQMLSTAACFAAFAQLERVLSRGRGRDYALAALMVAFSLLAHPMALLVFVLGVPVYVVVRALGTDEPAGRIVARLAAVMALGGALAAFWMLPFTAKSAWMGKWGALWKSLAEIGRGVWDGTVYVDVAPLVLWLGILGAVAGVVRRHLAATFLAGLFAVLLLVSSSTAFHELDLLGLSPTFGQVLFQRFAIPAKFALFLLGGFALAQLLQRAAAGLEAPRPSWRRYALVALMLFAAAPFVGPVAQGWVDKYGSKIGGVQTEADVRHRDDLQAFYAWSAALREREAAEGFYRIAYVAPYNDHYFVTAPIHNGTPAFKVGYLPATTYIHKPDKADDAIYRALDVKYVVSRGHPGRRSRLKEVERFGPIRVFRFLDWAPERYTLEGPGEVEVEAFEPATEERIAVKVRGAGPDSRLIFHVGAYANWRATLDGEPLEVTTAALGGHEHFLAVPARDGLVEVEYTTPGVNVLGGAVSWLALLTLGLLVAPRRRLPIVARLQARLAPWGGRAERHGVAAAIALVVVAGAAFALKPRPQAQAATGRPLEALLDQARVEVQRGRSPAKACEQTRAGHHQCSQRDTWNYVGPTAQRMGRELRRCIWAHPVQGATLRVTFPGLTLGRTLGGHHGLADAAVESFRAGPPVQLTVRVGDGPTETFRRDNALGWDPWTVDTSARAGEAADVTFEVTASQVGGRHFCFDAYVEE